MARGRDARAVIAPPSGRLRVPLPSEVGSPRRGRTIQQVLFEAVHECFVRYGPEKTSIEDVASSAGLSRRTVYRYFRTRDELVAAYVGWGAGRFHELARTRLDRLATFEAQMVELAVLSRSQTARAGDFAGIEVGAATVAFFVGTMHSEPMLRRSLDFLVPYVRAAQARREVRADVDPAQAAEWIARALFAVAELPSATFDADDPKALRRFVRQFLIRGLD
jgi:AcrR family transcriptional regulator